MSTIKLNFVNGGAELCGELTRHTVNQLSMKKCSPLFQQQKCELNFSKINRTDTAGLAWLLAIVEQANIKSCQLSFNHLPTDLIKLAKLSAVDTFLPIS
jgi:phospholipid transport system transporter-binding protein